MKKDYAHAAMNRFSSGQAGAHMASFGAATKASGKASIFSGKRASQNPFVLETMQDSESAGTGSDNEGGNIFSFGTFSRMPSYVAGSNVNGLSI